MVMTLIFVSRKSEQLQRMHISILAKNRSNKSNAYVSEAKSGLCGVQPARLANTVR